MNTKMNEHTRVSDLLPLYVSGGLDREQRGILEQHLAGCDECQADLALWNSVAGEITRQDRAVAAPRGLAGRALAQAGRPAQGPLAKLRGMALLLRAQAPLVQREIWPASAAVIGLGLIAALIAEQSAFLYALAPLIAAACVSLIYGPENDPAYELVLATPTSPRQILLARLLLVFGYNLALALTATLGMLPVLAAQPAQPLMGSVILAWLAPMTFLSAAALVLSLWVGAPNAISITYTAWLAQLLAGPLRAQQTGLAVPPAVTGVLSAYQQFWQSPALLLLLAAALFVLAIWMAGREARQLFNPA